MQQRTPFRIWNIGAFKVFLAAVVAISLVILAGALNMSRFYQDLHSRGIVTEGEVIRHEVRPGSRWGKVHYFHYRFRDKRGNPYTESTTLETLVVGDPVEVTYLPEDPTRHVPFRMSSGRVYQPLRDALLFALAAVGLTIGFGALVQWLTNRTGTD